MTTRKQSHSDLLKADFQRIYDEGITELPHLFPAELFTGPLVRPSRWRRFRWWVARQHYFWIALVIFLAGAVPLSAALYLLEAHSLVSVLAGTAWGQVSIMMGLNLEG